MASAAGAASTVSVESASMAAVVVATAAIPAVSPIAAGVLPAAAAAWAAFAAAFIFSSAATSKFPCARNKKSPINASPFFLPRTSGRAGSSSKLTFPCSAM